MGNKPEPSKSSDSMSGATLGIQLAVGMAVFTYIGYWIGQKTGGGQGWVLTGMFCGIFYCFYEIWKLIRKNKNANERTNGRNI